jgi:serine/threonine-protein kinase
MLDASPTIEMRPWHATAGDDESRDYLQKRLILMSKLMFASFVGMLAFIIVSYAAYPSYEPRLNKLIYLVSAIGLGFLSLLWRGLLLRRPLPMHQLRAIDAFYSIGTGSVFGASGALAYDLRSSAYICLTYALLLVLLRALVIPSTGKRTLVISTLTVLPMALATIGLGVTTTQDIPGPIYVTGGLTVCIMAVALATIGSNILYGLRRQISAAMQLGKYTLGEKIGEGGHGEVYLARHALLRRPTAIKVMLPDRVDSETLARFEREVQLMSQLTHANTVAVFDYGRSMDGVFYYAMEYLDGIDLEQLVLRYGAQPPDRAVGILIQVCGALAEAHGRGLIHRDIKPGNIILCERGDVPDVAKVVDFGLVKEIAANDGKSKRILGTPGYIAPESVTDPERVGPASDLYALGVVAYFLLTGRRVFEGKTSLDICVQHVTKQPIPPSQHVAAISPQLEEVVLRCLAKDPEQRPTSAGELARLLRAVPTADRWNDDAAVTWWRDYRATAARRIAAGPTHTITVDVGMRPVLDGSSQLSPISAGP